MRVRVLPAVLAGTVLSVLAGSQARSIVVPVPIVVGGISFPLPMAFLLPLLPVCLFLYGWGRADAVGERTAVRRVALLDAAAVLGATGLAAAVGFHSATGVMVARDFAGYLGLALVVRWCAGVLAAGLAVSVFPFVCASLGVRHGVPRVWAWPFLPAGSVPAALEVLVLLTVGVLLLWRGPLERSRQADLAAG
ncbi:hypothetical protein [Kitasatospora cheerisanensis]|uniref:hypothetical protein n=1 Tax=Kitasatospora cheerisanensis TaxID=81942 RepID=UPI0012ECED45|nr:hypothetical protein [Kitasatospora cheerisanensis]